MVKKYIKKNPVAKAKKEYDAVINRLYVLHGKTKTPKVLKEEERLWKKKEKLRAVFE